MSEVVASVGHVRGSVFSAKLRLWHLMLLVGYVAVAIVDIQDHRRNDPVLIGLACAGFAGYALLAWLGWLAAQRLEARVGAMRMLVLYLVALAALFFVATVVYLFVEYAYLLGSL